jgi:bifunctional DNA-binding transcriptional regulator/antitoxin component of YhaV-PrlF toxin-antitoxin module
MNELGCMMGRVQECGCIALPEDIQKQSGLYPGATYEIEITEDGAVVLLRPLQPSLPREPSIGASCG